MFKFLLVLSCSMSLVASAAIANNDVLPVAYLQVKSDAPQNAPQLAESVWPSRMMRDFVERQASGSDIGTISDSGENGGITTDSTSMPVLTTPAPSFSVPVTSISSVSIPTTSIPLPPPPSPPPTTEPPPTATTVVPPPPSPPPTTEPISPTQIPTTSIPPPPTPPTSTPMVSPPSLPPSPPILSTPTLLDPPPSLPISSSTPPLITPVTTDATSFASTLTGNAQPSSVVSSGNPGEIPRLLACAPCGRSKCSFSSNANPSTVIYSLMVGTPISNCQQGSNSSMKTTCGGSITIGETWSKEVSVGLALGDLHIEGGLSWTRSKSIMWEQKIEIEVKPMQMGVLVANIQYQQTAGVVRISSSDAFPVISNQPTRVVSYGSETIPCGSEFSGNISSPFNCTSSAQTGLHNTVSMGALLPIILTVSLLTSVFT